ncbi:RHS repeat-associated core domain-containing protein [Candidatus Pacearchaeota archaeon]|nr:RHS repeat-associated core domain-containing protein [Candidatus Pacearchaeota archaeon]
MKKQAKFYKFLPLIILISLASFLFIQSQFQPTGQVIQETATSGVTKATSYIYANGLVSSYDSDGKEKFYINDHLGSGSVVLDENGNKIGEESYFAFGEEKSSSGERFTYTGKELDDSGLYYYGARYYEPASGRFISPDPISGSIENPQSLNKYSYVLNNPNKFVDPSGMDYEPKQDATNVASSSISSSLAPVSSNRIMVRSGSDWNAAFYEDRTMIYSSRWSDIPSLSGEIGGVRGTGITIDEAEILYDVRMLDSFLQLSYKKNGLITFLDLGGHGDPDRIWFGSEEGYSNPSSTQQLSDYQSKVWEINKFNLHFLSNTLNVFDKDAVIVLASCSVGQGEGCIASHISGVYPNVHVYAPETGSREIRRNINLEWEYRDSDNEWLPMAHFYKGQRVGSKVYGPPTPK